MKKIILTLAVSILAVACGSAPTDKKEENKETKTTASVAKVESQGQYTVESLIQNGEKLVGEYVTLTGVVKHVCSHSGMRCFVFDNSDPATTVMITSGGNLGKFDPQSVTKELTVVGRVMETKISDEELAKQEQEYKESIEKDGEEAHCGTELANVKSIREKLKAEGKDHHSIYSVEAVEIVK